MPSPFPGMDPFIEGQEWEDFLHHLIEGLHAAIVPRVRPRYVVRVEKRVYVEHDPDALADVIRPDVAVVEREGRELASEGGVATALAVEPVVLALPMPEPREEALLTVRHRDTKRVVAVIEVLSPGNKRRGSDGRRAYLEKREAVLQSDTHLVELDLLRAGERLPTIGPLPPADYYAFVCRARRRPRAEVYAWPLRRALPAIPVPLAGEDADVALDLQSIFSTVYDRAAYDYSLDYRGAPEPALSDADAAWAKQILAESG